MTRRIRQTLIVIRKELRDSFRDRRALFSIFFGAIFFPIVITVMMNRVAERTRDADHLTIPVVCRENAPALIEWIQQQDGVTIVEGPPEPERVPRRRGTDERQSQERAADRIEMGDRVERQASEQLRRPVAEAIRRQSVAEFVDRQPDEQHDADDDRGGKNTFEVQSAPGLRGIALIVAAPAHPGPIVLRGARAGRPSCARTPRA